MRNYIFSIFHALIIACLGFTILGCGFKADPVYKDAPTKEKKSSIFSTKDN